MVPTHTFCLIIGAGAGGLVQAAELLRKRILQPSDIRILERNEDYGGVWHAATYPGAACDVFSCMYQISWHRKPDWNNLFPTAHELREYYKDFANHYDLRPRTTFSVSVQSARWSASDALWHVEAKQNTTGEISKYTCRVLIQAAGTYNQPNKPHIPGLDKFKGDVWHASEWNSSVDLTGKTVAYIGTGPTSVQVLPHIQAIAKDVFVVCRSMTYLHPFTDFRYPSWVKSAFRSVPGLLALYTNLIAYAFGLWAYFAFRPESWVAKNTEERCRAGLTKQVKDPGLRQILHPVGRFGSKRPLVSLNGFLQTLQEKNVHVTQQRILGADEDGLIMEAVPQQDVITDVSEDNADGSQARAKQDRIRKPNTPSTHLSADVIICGTGFIMQGWGGSVPTYNADGLSLTQHWEQYPSALFGTMTTSFPNLCLVNGPNTTSPWASLIKGLELQAAYNAQIVRHIFQKSQTSAGYSLSPRKDKQDAWVAAIGPRNDKLATSTKYGPGFYYLSRDGRNTFFWPWGQWWYAWKTRSFDVRNYVVEGH